MTKSMLGSFSQSAAMPSTSARRTRRRSRVSGSQTYSTSEPVPQYGVGGVEHERLGVAAARLDRPVARRALDGRLDQLGRDAHARAVHLRAGLGEELDGRRVLHVDAGLGEHVERRLVHAPAGVVVPDRQASCVHVAPPRSRGEPAAVSSRMARGYDAGLPLDAREGPLRRHGPAIASRRPCSSAPATGHERLTRDHAWRVMNVQQVYDDGLCMQCGTCVAVCPAAAVRLDWDLRAGHRLSVDAGLCTDCGACVEACPGPGLDFTAGAWWRERNDGAPVRDFLGPWRSLWFGWASDPRRAARRGLRRRGHGAAGRRPGVGLRRRRPGGGPRPAQSSGRGRRRLPDAGGGGRLSRLQVQRRRGEHAAAHGARRAWALHPGRPALPHPGAAARAAPLPPAARARRPRPGRLLRPDQRAARHGGGRAAGRARAATS